MRTGGLQDEIPMNATDENVGKVFKSWNGLLYRCERHQEGRGYWMRCTTAVNDLRCISERAIGTNYRRYRN